MPQGILRDKEGNRRNFNGKTALIAMGANQPLPDMMPQETLTAAIGQLSESGLEVHATSRLYVTPCFPAGAGPDYVNAAISAEWTGGPEALLHLLHAVEATFARVRVQRWGQRTLDLDLLALGDMVVPDRATWARWRDLPLARQMTEAPGQLVLPHPRMQDRAFVLVPLQEVAPDWTHPILGQSVTSMLARLPERDRADVKAL